MANAPSSVTVRQDFIVQRFSFFPECLNRNRAREVEKKHEQMNEKGDDVLSEVLFITGLELDEAEMIFCQLLPLCVSHFNKSVTTKGTGTKHGGGCTHEPVLMCT